MNIKKSTITIISIILVLAIGFGAAAAVYISQYARMTVFTGHIEQSTSTPETPRLILKSQGINVGSEGNIAFEDVAFPVLYGVESNFDSGVTTWQAEGDKAPISAATFVVSAENGDVENVSCKIKISGDVSAANALRFGITTSYYSEELSTSAYSYRIVYIDSVDSVHNSAESDYFPLGDSFIAEGDEVEIRLYAWVDGYALAKIGEYFDGTFTVDTIFTNEA